MENGNSVNKVETNVVITNGKDANNSYPKSDNFLSCICSFAVSKHSLICISEFSTLRYIAL